MKRGLLLLGLAALYLLHQDVWFWNDSRRLLGLPIGLSYHVLYCLVVAGWVALLVRFAWPAEENPS